MKNIKEAMFMDNFGTVTMRLFEGVLPSPRQMTVADRNGRTVTHEMARHNFLPIGFSDWELSDKDGWSVAHEAARYGNLPRIFSQWGIRDRAGRTVSHEAATRGDLPKGFTDFRMGDNKGWTVAHECVVNAKLPIGFPDWKTFGDDAFEGSKGKELLENLDHFLLFEPLDFQHSGHLSFEPYNEYSGEDLFFGLSKYLEPYGIASISPVDTAPDYRERNIILIFQPCSPENENLSLFCDIVADSIVKGVSCFHADDNNRQFASENGDWGIVVPLQSAALVFENMIELMSRYYYQYNIDGAGLYKKPLVRIASELLDFEV